MKTWFSIYFDLSIFPISSYPHFAMSTLAQIAHGIVTLYRLSTLDSSTLGFVWDTKMVRRELDLGNLVSILTERWGQVPLVVGFTGAEDGIGCWHYIKIRTAAIGRWWEGKLAAEAVEAEKQKEKDRQKEQEGSNFEGTGKEGQFSPYQAEPTDFGAMDLDLLDDTWIRDFMALESFQF